jgi:bacillithiol system protein YtxJ
VGIIAKYSGDYYLDYQSDPVTEWTDLISLGQLDEITKESYTIPVVIFKHSTRCNQSSALLKNFERRYNSEDNIPKPYFLDLITHRDVSDEIALKFGIKHESPQVIFVKDGVAVKHASHKEIVELI